MQRTLFMATTGKNFNYNLQKKIIQNIFSKLQRQFSKPCLMRLLQGKNLSSNYSKRHKNPFHHVLNRLAMELIKKSQTSRQISSQHWNFRFNDHQSLPLTSIICHFSRIKTHFEINRKRFDRRNYFRANRNSIEVNRFRIEILIVGELSRKLLVRRNAKEKQFLT